LGIEVVWSSDAIFMVWGSVILIEDNEEDNMELLSIPNRDWFKLSDDKHFWIFNFESFKLGDKDNNDDDDEDDGSVCELLEVKDISMIFSW